jgi:hypothetical protein
MSRHFVFTFNVHPMTGDPFPDPTDGLEATIKLDAMIQDSLSIIDRVFGRNLRYRVAQLEKGSKSDAEDTEDDQGDPTPEKPDKTGLHLQGYVETAQSIRLRTVWRGVPFGYVRPRRALRDTARDYCFPEKGSPFVGGYDPTHLAGPWEVGEWRESTPDEREDDPLAAAINMIVRGSTLPEVAYRFPRAFVIRANGLVRLHRTLWPNCSCCGP